GGHPRHLIRLRSGPGHLRGLRHLRGRRRVHASAGCRPHLPREATCERSSLAKIGKAGRLTRVLASRPCHFYNWKPLLTSGPPEEDAVDIDVVEDREAYSLICPFIEHDLDTAHRVLSAWRARWNDRECLVQIRRSQGLPRPARFHRRFATG